MNMGMTDAISSAIPAGPQLTPPSKTPASFLDLKAQYETIREEVSEAVARVLESQHFILGEEVKSLENEIAAMVGVRSAVGCASGSDALYLALLASEIGPGDEVITTPFTFVATAGSIARTGAKPVFVDIDPDTFNVDPAQIERALTPATKAIMPVHLFGLPADMNPILNIARARKLIVIEDAAQAIGSRYKGEFIGSLGDYGCFSFFPSKNLGGAGDGGLVTTSDPTKADRLRLLRAHGSRHKYQYEILGTNSRLDALQAAILRVKLKHLSEWTEHRRANARRYSELFRDLGLANHIQWPQEVVGRYHVYNQFTIRAKDRDALRSHLNAAKIPTDIYYPSPLHVQPAFANLGYHQGDFPNAETASREVLALPVYAELGASAQLGVAETISEFYKHVNNSQGAKQ
ncbi:MAG TPA: DegT/DnrJ/EryC1/StrS family aminotransferase [Candidatus Acidoferrales bacterium]|nr:DegT/DnrJ/EryC1/StrS family aminotransferase [Candidatus Acidoferrales bacterium]